MVQQKYVTPEEYFKIFYDETIEIMGFTMTSENDDDESATMLLRFKKQKDFIDPLRNTNVILAAYVTAHARLRLYRFLEELQDRVLYFDTGKHFLILVFLQTKLNLFSDSVFYTTKPGEKTLPLGDYLGDLTDELMEYGDGSYVTEFISAGPKNYSYKVYSTKDKKIHQLIKVKGHPLNFTAIKHVNVKTMKKMVKSFVKSGLQDEVVVVTPQIQAVDQHKMVTKLVRKSYRVVYDKRVVNKDYTTVPYGY